MKQLIIPDVHEEFERLQRALEHEHKAEKVIFLGDFFDSFKGVTENTNKTAEWLSTALFNEKYFFTWGNHDVQYAYQNLQLRCTGYERLREDILRAHLHPAHWERFRLAYMCLEPEDETFIFSHAGIAKQYWIDLNRFILDVNEAEESLETQKIHPLLRAGYARGGDVPYGGLTWLDWNREFQPIPGVNQIVGHTKGAEVRKKEGLKSVNYCLDTGLRHVALLDESGHLEVIEL